jgi:hypothetical protein
LKRSLLEKPSLPKKGEVMKLDVEYFKNSLQNDNLWVAIMSYTPDEVIWPQFRERWAQTAVAIRAFGRTKRELEDYLDTIPSHSVDETIWSPGRLKEKIRWEGGVIAALDYGIEANLITDPELARLWGVAEDCYAAVNALLYPLEKEITALVKADVRSQMVGHAAAFQYDPVWTAEKLETCDMCGTRENLHRFSWVSRCPDCNKKVPVTVGSDNPEPHRCWHGWMWGRCALAKDHADEEHDNVPYTAPERN